MAFFCSFSVKAQSLMSQEMGIAIKTKPFGPNHAKLRQAQLIGSICQKIGLEPEVSKT